MRTAGEGGSLWSSDDNTFFGFALDLLISTYDWLQKEDFVLLFDTLRKVDGGKWSTAAASPQ